MKKQKAGHGNKAVRIISWAGTLSLLFMLFLFLMVTAFSTNNLASQIKLLTEHPFTVNGDLSEVKTNLALMRVCTERLQSYNRPGDVRQVGEGLDDLSADMDLLLAEIGNLYLGPAEDITQLKGIYEEIRKAHEAFLTFAALPSSTTDKITAYEEEHLYPLYEAFEKQTEKSQLFVRGTWQNIFSSAGQMSRSTLVWSLVITAAITLGLLAFQYALRKMNRRLYDKNRQFEILSNTVDEAFMIFSEQRQGCDFVSGSAGKILGIPAAQLQKDRSLVYRYMSEDAAAEIHRMIHVEKKSAWDTFIEYHCPQSVEPCWMQLRCYRVEENGGINIMTLTDRTQERQANQALQDALVNAQNANNAKRDFLSRMSHEIRTPMNAIIGMATIAAASIEDRRRVEDCLEKIGYSSKHLLLLINDVLDMSRIESNRMRLNKEPFELYQFLNNFVSVVYPQASGKGLEFTEKTTGFGEHTTYLGDSLRLNQILLNLTSNAIKFTPSGGKVSLEVSCLHSRGKKAWLRFVVSDTGIGMDKEGLARLYTPFEQADATIARKYGGTGLGMSITQNLIALMGGYIDVKSTPNKGTTFTVEIPFEQSGVDIQPLQEELLETLEVLVADDEKDICEHTVLLLEKMRIHAEWVLSGMEAVAKAVTAQEAGHGFDVCFIDWKMPDMDGIETTRRIREKIGRDTPIIIISAYDWTEIEDEARAAGANAFITKPLFQSSLYNVLVSVTNGAFGRAENASKAKGTALAGKRLLLAEDNVLNMEIAETLLEMNGAIIEGVENGQEAVEHFLRREPGYFDAILMDIQMPVMDGCTASRHIRGCGRKDAREIPIIAITANAFTEDISSVLAAGMNVHVSKPIDIEQLCAVLDELCHVKPEETAGAKQ